MRVEWPHSCHQGFAFGLRATSLSGLGWRLGRCGVFTEDTFAEQTGLLS